MRTFIFGMLALATVNLTAADTWGQSDVVRMFLSTQLKADPAQMQEAKQINAGDPIFFVIATNPKYKYTIGDLASTNPKTGEKNIFICLDMASSTMHEVCPAILRTPVSDQVLSSRSAVYTIVPASNEINAESSPMAQQVLAGFAGHGEEDIELKVTYENFDTRKTADFRALIGLSNWHASRWKSYDDAFKARANAEKQKEDAVAGLRTKAIVTEWVKTLRSKRNDLALERDIMKWWRGPDPSKIADPVVHIYFLEPNYEIIRNEFGIVIRKSLPALILWKERSSDKCHIQWRSFGYQSMGGATFSNEMEAWNLADNGYPRYYQLTEGREVRTGAWYDVDCAPFVK